MTAKKPQKDTGSEKTGAERAEDPRGRKQFVEDRHGPGGPKVREGGHAEDDINLPSDEENAAAVTKAAEAVDRDNAKEGEKKK